ncbi:phosphopantothenoylcysteine decarboxylase/phosphopantothenate--cysteine ligase [Trueperella bonasi]|uniref:Coenzyme A biosynthesis bifunctional protein CoaBC n=1 Tax=Trueperella bonasi TaxID=312286 RepID=A0ABT9NDH8_9ACTO|nr:bifunctional phosphopantothenoylcysteine decarboxylase/phosphopantothenate--cysteine ligase CoaBC [Trueperella bonasi]MDP9805448.1 phosphopantothenoylcysteine decarboxylase/phosphopantothenate--cysteine ligase [Trueperella bonasi]
MISQAGDDRVSENPMPRVLLGVTGGIAAYKVPAVIRGLRARGIDVVVVPTPEALKFVGKTTWEAISGHPVHVHTTEGAEEVVHVRTGQDVDLVLIAPATANTIAKVAAGIADNLLTASVLMATGPVLMAPAMHTEMWNNAATQANVDTLGERGVEFIGPESGQLTGTDSGLGRMSEPEAIVEAVLRRLANDRVGASDLAGTRMVISAGGTREPIDPVRYIANRSTGRMGIALANEAARRGAEVHLVAANIDDSVMSLLAQDVHIIPVITVLELQDVMEEMSGKADVLVMSAAVSDFRVDASAQNKIKRGADLTLKLIENPDILAGLARARRSKQTIVGFAAETGDETADYLEHGRQKARRKGADLLVINQVGAQSGFGNVDTAVTIVDGAGSTLAETTGSKADVAVAIIDAIKEFRTS